MKENHHQAQNRDTITKQLFGNTATTALFTTAIVLLASVLYMVFTYSNVPIDQQVFDTIAPHITKSRTAFMKIIAFLGNHSFLVPANLLLLLYFIIKKNRYYALKVGIIGLTSLSIMSLLKRSFHRPRPAQPLVDGITNFSFPSGHAFMSIAFYGLLIWLSYEIISNKTLRRFIIFLLVLLILAIGFSRIYLRVHYTTDVIAGFCFGTIWLIISLWLAKKIQQRQ
jgi:membrane-associated phospholipid phosphatase